MSKLSFMQNKDSILERDFNQAETLQLLQMNKPIFWSWGVSEIHRIDDRGLIFKVNGYKFKGLVLITLGWGDTYTFRLLNSQYNEKYKQTDVYFEDLVSFIDEKIEKQPEYQF